MKYLVFFATLFFSIAVFANDLPADTRGEVRTPLDLTGAPSNPLVPELVGVIDDVVFTTDNSSVPLILSKDWGVVLWLDPAWEVTKYTLCLVVDVPAGGENGPYLDFFEGADFDDAPALIGNIDAEYGTDPVTGDDRIWFWFDVEFETPVVGQGLGTTDAIILDQHIDLVLWTIGLTDTSFTVEDSSVFFGENQMFVREVADPLNVCSVPLSHADTSAAFPDTVEFRWNRYHVGDCDGSAGSGNEFVYVYNINDPTFLLNWSFGDGIEPPCQMACDMDNNGTIETLVDAVYMLEWLFSAGPGIPDLFDPADCSNINPYGYRVPVLTCETETMECL